MLQWVKNFFSNSEVIAWGGLQILFGCVWGVLSVTDMSPILPQAWIPIWAIFNGIVTAWLRTRNALPEIIVVADPATGKLTTIKFLRGQYVPEGAKVISETGGANVKAG